MTQAEREQTVKGLGYSLGCKLIFQWIKTSVINMREFMELLQCLPIVPPDLRKTPGNERIEFLKDVIVIAIESGATKHWARRRDYDYRKGYVKIKKNDSTHEDWQVVNIQVIDQGLTRIRDPDFDIFGEYRSNILWADLANDASHLEGITANIIVQAALFNEILYD